MSKAHRIILDILNDSKPHPLEEFTEEMSYDGLRGRISELNKWGYVIRRTDDSGSQSRGGTHLRLFSVPNLDIGNEILSCDLQPNEDGRVEIIPIGDVHYGNPCFTESSEELLDGYIEYIMNTEGAYTVLMGDLIESANRRATFKLKVTPQEQYEWIIKKFRPLADAGKIIAMISGNHENWIFTDKGFNIMKMLAISLDVPYLGDAGYIGMKVGKEFYTAYVTHPASGVTKKSSKIRMLEELGAIHEVNMIMCGHIHSIIGEDQLKLRPNFVSGDIDKVKQLLISTGAYLEYGDYAEQRRYKPEKMGAPKVKLYSHEFDMHMGK